MARRTEGETTGSRGRIAAGDVVLRFGSPHGALAERLAPDERPAPRPRPASPPAGPFPDVVDRVDAIERAGTALVAARPVLLHGPPGSGKTTLLRHLSRTAAHDAPDGAGAWPDGTILLSARDTPVGDLLQLLFRALHASETSVHATDLQLENGLRERQALVLVDDLHGSVEEIRTILETASGSAFAIGSEEDVDGLDVVRVGLDALPPDAGVELVSRATGREASPLEAARIRELHRAVEGRPLLLLQTAALLHGGAVDLESAAAVADADDPPGMLAGRVDGTLPDAQRRALLALEAVAPASLAVSDAKAIADLEDPAAALEGLAHRGLARVEGARYRAAGGLAATVAERHDLDAWQARALDHFAARAAREAPTVHSGPEREPLRWALDRAVAASRWGDVLALVDATERDLASSGRWEAWGVALERGLEAARASDEAAAEARMLHQRGTRALALDDDERATHDLERALELREALGDEAGAAASRSNLALLGEERPVGQSRPADRRSTSGLPWVALGVALVVITAVALLVLRGRDAGPEAVEAGAVGFEAVAVGGERLAPVVVDNAEPGPVEVGSVAIAGEDATDFSVVEDGCSETRLDPESRCVIVVSFRPRETGERTAALVVPFDEERPWAVALSGRGLAEAEAAGEGAGDDPLGIGPGRVSFGEQPTGTRSGALPIAIVNRGNDPERVAVRLDPAAADEFTIESDRCSNERLPGGKSCLVEVSFRPVEPGLRSGSLEVRDLGTDETRTVSLSGTGTGAAEGAAPVEGEPAPAGADTLSSASTALAAGTTAIDFGEVPAGDRSEPRSVEIENRGAEPVEIASASLGGLDAPVFAIVEDRCSGRRLAVGATCTIDLAFTPAEGGGWSARLIVRDPTGDGVEIALDGTGG